MMAKISEQGFHAGWKNELEYDLWKIVETGPSEYGFIEVDADRINKLLELSKLSDGWITYGSETPEWIQKGAWLKRYQSWEIGNG
jgi:hypothetical protein